MNKIELKHPITRQTVTVCDLLRAARLIREGWTPVQATVVKAGDKKS